MIVIPLAAKLPDLYPKNVKKITILKYKQSKNGKKNLTSKEVYIFNDKGQDIETQIYHSFGSFLNMKTRSVKEYDQENRVKQKKYFSAQGQLEGIISYTYDDHGNLVLEIEKRKNKKRTERRFYDKKNQIVKITMSKNGTINGIVTFQYDQSGNLIKEQSKNHWNGWETLTTYFSYDKNGNQKFSPQIFGSHNLRRKT